MNKINQLKELLSLLNDDAFDTEDKPQGLNCHIGEYVIIRTYSAGVWFGKLEQKSGNEVILTDARRMYQWWAAKSISLSGVAKYGINHDKSKICPAVEKVWLEAIEILTLTDDAVKSLKDAKDVEAQ